MTTASTDMAAAALWYARHGFDVCPLHEPVGLGCSCGKPECSSIGKHPRTLHGLKDASCDPATIEGWWGQWPTANIGLSTETMIVVDIDPRNGGPADRSELIEEFGAFPQTAEALSGGGGRHVFFRNPGGERVPPHLAPGVDLKGSGGYVVASPSLHASGARYAFDGLDGAKALLTLADPPQWLLARIRAGAKSAGNGHTAEGEPIPEGRRNQTLTAMAGAMRRRGMTPEAILAGLVAENASRCRPPLPESEVRQIAASVGRYEPEPVAEQPAQDADRPHLKVIEVPSVSTITGGDIKFVVDGLILEGGLTMFSGPAGCGKTTLAAAIGGHVACGVPFAGRAVQQRPVLLLDRENPLQVVQERLYRLGMTDGPMLRWWGGWLQDEAPSPTSAVVLEWIASLEVKPLIVIDSGVAC